MINRAFSTTGATTMNPTSSSATSMALAAGTRLDPYEIVTPLVGAGSMRKVYRALAHHPSSTLLNVLPRLSCLWWAKCRRSKPGTWALKCDNWLVDHAG